MFSRGIDIQSILLHVVGAYTAFFWLVCILNPSLTAFRIRVKCFSALNLIIVLKSFRLMRGYFSPFKGRSFFGGRKTKKIRSFVKNLFSLHAILNTDEIENVVICFTGKTVNFVSFCINTHAGGANVLDRESGGWGTRVVVVGVCGGR